jgi:hypothetical protein
MAISPLRVCIIGNSHAGALKEAWDEIGTEQKYASIEMTFFAARGDRLSDLEIEGNSLRAGGPDAANLSEFLAFTSGGADRIQGDAYDLFLVYGGNLRFVNLPLTYSQAVLHACVADISQASLHYSITQKLRKITDRPVFVAVNPLRIASLGKEPMYSYDKVLDVFRDVYAPFDIRFVPQPEETRDAHNQTLPEFTTGSRRLDMGRGAAAHDAGDGRHMNTAYGRIWLHRFLVLLQDVPKAASAEKAKSF